ncbi:LuxR C-terminal-related transcriptional regulator [Mycolicibacterium sp. BiH015]|uniref:helix-turn-helix transcriptional regulator n=1 Tax=Mycolicibacterium sp. BiH015 TaxID=3018808 RepID=UPI0022E8D195|nr:LuxR family transcriptional regulator [Mycolicibacterium sp. BiH015]MDA2893921.1 LuxR C-terminal-related transcriptional regulator [Mycolicibacterium sp. BiH015]
MKAALGLARTQVEAAVAGSRMRAVLYGAAGVGKTSMARKLAREFSRKHPRLESHWVSATASASNIPFGAFSHLIEVTGGAEPTALLRAARRSLCATHGLILVVDDAHQLDTLSATLVHQLAINDEAHVMLTVRAGEPVPDAVTALWKDGILPRHDILPFDRRETAQLLKQILGGAVEDVSAARIFEVSQGNPLYLRHLVEAALATGTLRQVEGVWQLRGQMTLTAQLSTLIDQHLDGLPEQVRMVLDFLAIEDPLAVDDLAALVGADAVAMAETTGVVTVADRSGTLFAHPFHPIYTERVRSSLGLLTMRNLRKRLTGQLSERASTNLSARLRMAALAMDTDEPPSAAELIGLSWEAMGLGDLALGERLARAALDQSDTLSARLPLAHSLSWQGRGREADDALNPVDPDTLSQWDLMAWTLPKAANRFWMLSESEEAIEYLAAMRMRISERGALHTIDALTATFAMNVGDPKEAIRVASGVLEANDAQDLAVAWASAAATLSSARMGRFADVDNLARRGLEASHPGLLRFTIGLGQSLALIMSGEVASAESLARHYLSFSEFQQPGRAIGEVLLGSTLVLAGEFGDAVTLLRQAAAALTSTGYSWGPLALTALSQALGQQGRAADAAAALERAEASHGVRSAIYAPELALARAWSLAAARNMRAAVASARDAVHVALQTGQEAVALRALQEGARLGDTQGVGTAIRLNDKISCAAGELCISHLRALADGDAPALMVVARKFEDAGMVAIAADAAAQAAAMHQAHAERSGETAARTYASALSQRCGNPATPALEKVLNPTPLTDREREVAVMVSQGQSNKSIADRLSVSVRTVEGHVYKACMKLGLPDRAALAVAMGAAAHQGMS